MQIRDQHLVQVYCDDSIKHKQFSIPQGKTEVETMWLNSVTNLC